MTRIAGYKDEEYIRGKAPMTKREIRILTLTLMGIEPNDTVIDIGAGSGGLTMEIAHAAYNGKVYAVEHKQEAIEIIQKNIKKFNAEQVEIIEGKAPETLGKIDQADKIVIGGTGGNLEEILKWSSDHLVSGGGVVSNFIVLENAAAAMTLMKKYFTDVDIVQVGVNRGRKLAGMTMLEANNPIFIITGGKE
jgi:cobalt-precorrin-6B (C15)-methyltransferase